VGWGLGEGQIINNKNEKQIILILKIVVLKRDICDKYKEMYKDNRWMR